QPIDRHPADLGALEVVQRVPRRATALRARLDLDEHEVRPVVDHEIELPVARAVVASEHRVTEALEVLRSEILAALTSHVPDIRHAGDAMAAPGYVSALDRDVAVTNVCRDSESRTPHGQIPC